MRRELDGNGHTPSTIDIFVGTWNVGNAPPPSNITPFIKPRHVIRPPDIYAVGVQEQNGGDRTHWIGRVGAVLGSDYELLSSCSLVQMNLIIFCRQNSHLLVSDVKSDRVPCGIGNIYGNKGAVGVSMNVCGTTFAFISSHLPAHEGKTQLRNEGYHRIVTEMTFGNSMGNVTNDVTERFDNVFWFGDLNYRIRGNRTIMNCCITNRMFEVMLANDELGIERAAGCVFQGFQEPKLSFPPTYKFDVGEDTYDSSSKNRIPSWTDRVLYKSKKRQDGESTKVRNYNSSKSIRTSDHRPVYAVFEVGLNERPKAEKKDDAETPDEVESSTCTIS